MWPMTITKTLNCILLIILIVPTICYGALSDKRLCGDPQCQSTISYAKGVITYNGIEPGMVSFRANAKINVKSKSAGSNLDLWGIEVGGRRGYAPKRFLLENKVIVKTESLIEVPVETTDSSVLAASENTVKLEPTVVPTTAPLEMEKNEQSIVSNTEGTNVSIDGTKISHPASVSREVKEEIIDGTRIPLAGNDIDDNEADEDDQDYGDDEYEDVEVDEQQELQQNLNLNSFTSDNLDPNGSILKNPLEKAINTQEAASAKDEIVPGNLVNVDNKTEVEKEPAPQILNDIISNSQEIEETSKLTENIPDKNENLLFNDEIEMKMNSLKVDENNINTVMHSQKGDIIISENKEKSKENVIAQNANRENSNGIQSSSIHTEGHDTLREYIPIEDVVSEVNVSKQLLSTENIIKSQTENHIEHVPAITTVSPIDNVYDKPLLEEEILTTTVSPITKNSDVEQKINTKNEEIVSEKSEGIENIKVREAKQNIADEIEKSSVVNARKEEGEAEEEKLKKKDNIIEKPQVETHKAKVNEMKENQELPIDTDEIIAKQPINLNEVEVNQQNIHTESTLIVPDSTIQTAKQVPEYVPNEQIANESNNKKLLTDDIIKNENALNEPLITEAVVNTSSPIEPLPNVVPINEAVVNEPVLNESVSTKPVVTNQSVKNETVLSEIVKEPVVIDTLVMQSGASQSIDTFTVQSNFEPTLIEVQTEVPFNTNEHYRQLQEQQTAKLSEKQVVEKVMEEPKPYYAEPEVKITEEKQKSEQQIVTVNKLVEEIEIKQKEQENFSEYSQQQASNDIPQYSIQESEDLYVDIPTYSDIPTYQDIPTAPSGPIEELDHQNPDVVLYSTPAPEEDSKSVDLHSENAPSPNVGVGSVEEFTPNMDEKVQSPNINEVPVESLKQATGVHEGHIEEKKGLFGTILGAVNNFFPNKKQEVPSYDTDELNKILFSKEVYSPKPTAMDDQYCEKISPNDCPSKSEKNSQTCLECNCDWSHISMDDFVAILAHKVLEMSQLLACLVIAAASTIFLLFGYYCFCNSSREGALLSKLNQLERSLLASHKENSILQEDLLKTRGQLSNIEDSSFGSNDMVMMLKRELTEETVAKEKLKEQVSTLEKELESAAEAGLELNKIVTELLNNQSGDESILNSVEELQRQLNEQQGTILQINNSLAEKSRENSELQMMFAEQGVRLNAEIASLQQDNDELETDKGNLQTRLEDVKGEFEETMSKALEAKNGEIKHLQNEIVACQTKWEDEHSKWQTGIAKIEALEECLKNVKRDPNVNIKDVIDVANVKAELLDLQKKRASLTERLGVEQEARKLSESQLEAALTEVEQFKQNFNQSEKDKLEAQTRLEVLSNYFKEKETQLQKELSLKEAMWLKQQGETTSTVDRMTALQEQVQSLQSQNDALRAEMEAQLAAHKAQTGTLENRAHETWLAARRSERRYEEARAEATALRHKLTALVGGNANEVNRDGKLNNDMTTAPSPIHMESPGSPLLGRMPLPFLPPPPFMGPPPPFMGMPPPPPFVGGGVGGPPPLLGRMLSPPTVGGGGGSSSGGGGGNGKRDRYSIRDDNYDDDDDDYDSDGDNEISHDRRGRRSSYSPPPTHHHHHHHQRSTYGQRSLEGDRRYGYSPERDLYSTYDSESDYGS